MEQVVRNTNHKIKDIIKNLEGITKELNRINYNYKFKTKNFEDSEERPLILETQEEILQIEVILSKVNELKLSELYKNGT
ncbi:uncharacterized protein OCT59_007120 [Rhizophagus irregularis]|uniref:uncharacterized protein n=1 Tax=Rhizophagus irregularis TaxID=588596 RepID=UPI00331E83A2|nr:hypothetical protein OCT59_007120 [Rhizophagus irregularis]